MDLEKIFGVGGFYNKVLQLLISFLKRGSEAGTFWVIL